MLGVVVILKVVRTYLKQNPICHILTITSIAPSPPRLVTISTCYAKVIVTNSLSEDLIPHQFVLKLQVMGQE